MDKLPSVLKTLWESNGQSELYLKVEPGIAEISGDVIDHEQKKDKLKLIEGLFEDEWELKDALTINVPKKLSPEEENIPHDISIVSVPEVLAVSYSYNSADISFESFDALNKLVNRLFDNPNLRITIAGHTDSTGNPEANLYLSRLRATSVRDYLVESGIDSSRLKVEGYGDTQPIASNSSREGRQKNRRIEVLEENG